MPHTVTIPNDLFARLQKHAVPLVDTLPTVIERALAALEAGHEGAVARLDGIREFNPAAAPDLTYTTPRRVVVDGKILPKAEWYWNPLMMALVSAAAKRLVRGEELVELIGGAAVVGKRGDAGYKTLPDALISVQGRDANAAWRAIYRVASGLNIPVEVEFAWQNHPKAAMPNTVGLMVI